MSTDRKRLTSAIQRIAREDPEIRKLLNDYRNSGGKPSESATTGPGGDDRKICCDGSTDNGSGSNPGSVDRDPSDGGQDASEDGLNENDPADLSDMGPGSLTGVKDCTTGEPVCFDGSDWIPPDGWSSPTDPPVDPNYEEGYFWALKRGGSYYACSAGFTGCHPGNCDGFLSPDYSCGKVACSPGSDDPFCNPSKSDILVNGGFWPEDGCTNLAIKGGKLVGSKFDPENDGSWSKPRDSVELCDEFGNSFELKPSASGGWKSISADNPGDGYLYDSSGAQIARISGDEYSDPSI